MIAPDRLLKLEPPHLRRHGAALASVQPAIRTEDQRIRERLRVLDPEAAQQDFGRRIRNVITVAIRIEKQVRRLHDKHAAVPEGDARGEVEPVDEILRAVGHAVGIRILEDRDPIRPARTVRRRLRHSVVDGARVAVDLHAFQSGRIRILQVLHDPEPPAVVELDAHRLRHHRLARDQVHREARGDGHAFYRLGWPKALRVSRRHR